MIRVHFIKRRGNLHSNYSQSSSITFINWQNLWCFVFSQILFLEFCRGNTCRWTNQMNRPLALRCHVTNASFKQWVGILLLPKIDKACKNYGTPVIWEEAHSREIFMALWFFNKVVWFLYWPPFWRAYSCPPTWQPKLLLQES